MSNKNSLEELIEQVEKLEARVAYLEQSCKDNGIKPTPKNNLGTVRNAVG